MQVSAVVYALIVIISFLLSFQDIKHKKVNLNLCVMFLLSCVCYGIIKKLSPCFFPFFIFSTIGILYFLLKKKKAFGAADYFIVFGISFVLDSEYWPCFLILCGLIGIIFSLLNKKEKEFPFIPSMLLSFFTVDITKYFI